MTENRNEHVEMIDDGTSEFSKYYVAADITTSFLILIGVFFPSVTGDLQLYISLNDNFLS